MKGEDGEGGEDGEIRGDPQRTARGETMSTRFNFSPVSSAESGTLRLASGWFIFNGVVYGLLVGAALVTVILGKISVPTNWVFVGLLVQGVAAVGIVWTGILLGRRVRLGGYLALGFILLPIVVGAIARQPIDVTEIVFGVLGVIVLMLIWHELRAQPASIK